MFNANISTDPTRHRRQPRAALLPVLATMAVFACPANAADKAGIFSTRDGAIRGYDPVAYFTEGQAVRGTPQLSYRWKDADWRFASQAHLDLFRANPDRYAPRYGGWCAYAMSRGRYASIVPQAWTIHEGRLYLNYSKAIQRKWSKDLAANVGDADRHWRALRER